MDVGEMERLCSVCAGVGYFGHPHDGQYCKACKGTGTVQAIAVVADPAPSPPRTTPMTSKPLYVRPFSINPAQPREILDGSGRCIASASIGAARALVRHLNDPTPEPVNAPAAAVGDLTADERVDVDWIAAFLKANLCGLIADRLVAIIDRLAAVPAVHVQGVTEEEQAAIAEARKRDTNSAASADAWRTEYDQNRADLLAIISRLTRTTPSGEWQEVAAVIEAARCIKHWHDTLNGEGMVVSASHVRDLWAALEAYDAPRAGRGA